MSKDIKSDVKIKGFTLIEVFIVTGIISLILGLSAFIDLNSYRGDSFRSERGKLVTILQTARSESMNNINQHPHGVVIGPLDHPNSYVSYDGASYSEAVSKYPESIYVVDMGYPIGISPHPVEVTFSQLSGDASYSGDITLTDTERDMNFVISINHEGRINW
jgi:Tfp pilus assembly protein FimT